MTDIIRIKMHLLYCMFFFISIGLSSAQDIGRVFIGDPSDGGIPSKNVFKLGMSQTVPTLQVYALVYSSANPTVTVQITEDVTISCTVTNSGSDGFSSFQILNGTLSAASNSTSLTLRRLSLGRPESVQCVGTSASNVCPARASGGSQFCPTTSASNVVSLAVTPAVTISFCQEKYIVSRDQQSFILKFSKPITSTATIQCDPRGSVTIPEVPVGIAEQQATMTYISAASSVNVTCTATAHDSSFTESASAMFELQTYKLEFQPVRLEINNSSFSSLLTLNLANPANSAVSLKCQAKVADNINVAEASLATPDCTFQQTNAATSISTTTTAAPTTTLDPLNNNTGSTALPAAVLSPTSFWEVMDPTSLKIGEKQQYTMVTVQRQRAPIDMRTEIVVTTCCVVSNNSVYTDQSAVAVAVAHLAPLMVSNVTEENPTAETFVQNTGYVEIAPCPCDLTSGVCDVNCCCDEDCDAFESAKQRFSGCVAGLKGGQDAVPARHSCNSRDFNLPDWQPLTCVYSESNAYLGLYYQHVAKLTSLVTVTTQANAKYKGRFSFSETEKRFESHDSLLSSYQLGTVVGTQREDPNSNNLGTLALPQPGISGACNPRSPVQYLVDVQSTCAQMLTQETCTGSSVFDGRVYAINSDVSGCGQSFKISSLLKSGAIAPADVRYYCANATEVQNYQGIPNNPIPSSNTFPGDLAGVSCDDGVFNSTTCLDYNKGRTYSPDTPLPASRCFFDTGYAQPPTPTYSTQCSNVVLEVRYNFEWSGSEITKLTADVILGNISIPNIPSSGVAVSQKFSVQWQAKVNVSSSPLDNYQNIQGAYDRSGAGGYDLGKPLFSGVSHYNMTSGDYLVDPVPEKQMAIWRPGVDGLCANAKRQTLTFGDDAQSACKLKLTFDDLNGMTKCADLRQLITNHLNVLMASNVIGMTGNNDLTSGSFWVPVVRQNLQEIVQNATDSLVDFNDTSSRPNNETSWADAIQGSCLVPSGVELVLLYAKAGERNGQDRLQVKGAYVNYTLSTWTMNCAGSNSQRCQVGSSVKQDFLLTSSASFIKVPVVPPTPRIKFYTKFDMDNCESDSCYRFFTDFVSDTCYYDTCWQELAYPLTGAYNHGEDKMYTLPFFLVTVLGVVGYVAVAKPGWSIVT